MRGDCWGSKNLLKEKKKEEKRDDEVDLMATSVVAGSIQSDSATNRYFIIAYNYTMFVYSRRECNNCRLLIVST